MEIRRLPLFLLILVPAVGGPMGTNMAPGVAQPFSVGSVRGTYALSYTFTALAANDSAALGLATFDGRGSFSGSFVQNWPGPVCGLPRTMRCVAPGTNVGTYSMSEDGTGHVALTNTFSGPTNPGRIVTQLTFDGVVTRARVVGALKLATEIFSIQGERPFVANIGGLASGLDRRLPDAGVFTAASLEGTYAVSSVVGAVPAGTLGVARFDGRGALSSTLTVNLRAARADRQVIRGITGIGTYSLNADGMGTLTLDSTLPDGSSLGQGNFDLVVREARVVGSRKVAGECLAIQRERGALSRKLVALELKKLPD